MRFGNDNLEEWKWG